MVTIHGVDISSHQPDWTPAQGDSFVFVKSTEGRSYRNPAAAAQVKRARTAGLVVGWYHFLWPQYDRGTADGKGTSTKEVSGSPEVQAAFFLDSTPALSGDLLALDWEHAGSFTSGQSGGYASYQEKNRFLAEVKRRRPDLKIVLYVNRYMWNASDKKAGNGLWLAEYAAKPTIAEPWLFWQYADHTSDGRNLDQNQGNFATVADLRNWISPPVKPPEEVMAITDAEFARIQSIFLSVLRSESGKRAIAEAAWMTDDIIPAGKTETDSKNTAWKPAIFLRETYNDVSDLPKGK
jgi:GH25 family lysozyme M1 (1,4-beta-N-acetylmuramidase)